MTTEHPEDGPRHIVPGNGGMMQVSCEDYDAYVAQSLAALTARLERAQGALRACVEQGDWLPAYSALTESRIESYKESE